MSKTPTAEKQKEVLIAKIKKVQLVLANNKVILDLMSKELGNIILQEAHRKNKKIVRVAASTGQPISRVLNWLYGNANIPPDEARKLWKAATA